jgi:hypothetical protein
VKLTATFNRLLLLGLYGAFLLFKTTRILVSHGKGRLIMNTVERIEYDTGLVMFKNVFSPELIRRFNEEIDVLTAGCDAYPGKLLNEKAISIVSELQTLDEYRQVEKFCRRVSRLRYSATFRKDPSDEVKCYIRCANAQSDSSSHLRHFDSYLMTILIPINIVTSPGDNGDLVVYRKKNFTTSVAGNVFRKTLTKFDNSLPLKYRRKKTLSQLESKLCDKIVCAVGNVYFFNGYNIKHCNFSVSSGERRTLLIHAYDPKNSLGLSDLVRKFRT